MCLSLGTSSSLGPVGGETAFRFSFPKARLWSHLIEIWEGGLFTDQNTKLGCQVRESCAIFNTSQYNHKNCLVYSHSPKLSGYNSKSNSSSSSKRKVGNCAFSFAFSCWILFPSISTTFSSSAPPPSLSFPFSLNPPPRRPHGWSLLCWQFLIDSFGYPHNSLVTTDTADGNFVQAQPCVKIWESAYGLHLLYH